MLGKLFISYRADSEGNDYKNMLVAWSKNPHKNFFDVKFNDTSIGTSINSEDEAYIRKKVKEKIKESDVVLVLIGKNTSTSDWVNWEIDTAFEMGKPLVAIKINKFYQTPTRLYGKNVKWAYSFEYKQITEILSNAKN